MFSWKAGVLSPGCPCASVLGPVHCVVPTLRTLLCQPLLSFTCKNHTEKSPVLSLFAMFLMKQNRIFQFFILARKKISFVFPLLMQNDSFSLLFLQVSPRNRNISIVPIYRLEFGDQVLSHRPCEGGKHQLLLSL